MEDKFQKIDGVELHYTMTGDGDKGTVVLMHGWGCNTTTVASIERVALAAGRRVLNVDFPGHGKSAEPTEAWGIEKFADQIEHLLDAEGIERPVLIGHSFGGRVAIVISSRREVEKVVLVDAAGVKPRRSLNYYRKVYTFKLARKLLTAVLGKQKAEPIIERMRGKKGSSDYASSSPMMRRVMSIVVNEDLCHLMPKIKAPTLLIWGESDTATPLSDAKKMEKLIPEAGLVSFAGAGHYSFLDNPRQFGAVLTSFLNS